ncbi:restriction endonuclease subunit S [Mycoplasmopsis synoviae]|uniref:restriction endonuclease subunit S n=1 Tax=Mycoplasmopsis synoviae TaxID=2109 RepID=UPI00307AFCF2
MKKQVENKNIKKKYPKIRFKEFSETWEQCKLKNLLELHKPWAILDDAKKVGKYKLYGVNGLIGYVNYGEIKSDFISIVKDGSVGKINFVEKNSAVTTTMHCFTAKKSNIHFVYLLLKNFDFSNYIVGSIIAHIHFSNYGNAKVNLPKHEEQNLISNLFKYFGNLITLHQKKLDLLKKFKKTLLEKMFSLNEESFPKIRFNGFFDAWEQCEVGNLFEITRGETLAKKFITNFKTRKNIYPVYSSQTTNNGLMGYYKTYLFENAITWTTDGCYAGNFNYRPEKFYSTNVNGVLISNNGYANYAVSEIINSVAQKYVTKTVNPKLMSNVVNQIKFFAPKIKEQIKISNFIFNLNNLITLHQKKLKLIQKFKKTLLEKMFV